MSKVLETTAIQVGLSSGFLNVVFRNIGNILWKRDELNARPLPTRDITVEDNQCAFYKSRPLWLACAECKGILYGRNEPMYINFKTMSNQQIPLEHPFPKTSFPYHCTCNYSGHCCVESLIMSIPTYGLDISKT